MCATCVPGRVRPLLLVLAILGLASPAFAGELDGYVGCFPVQYDNFGDVTSQGPLPWELGPLLPAGLGWVPIGPGCGPSRVVLRYARERVGGADASLGAVEARLRAGAWSIELGLPAFDGQTGAVLDDATLGVSRVVWRRFEQLLAVRGFVRVPTATDETRRAEGGALGVSYIDVRGPISDLEKHVLVSGDVARPVAGGPAQYGVTAIAGLQTDPRDWASFGVDALSRTDQAGEHLWIGGGVRVPVRVRRRPVLLIELSLAHELVKEHATIGAVALGIPLGR